MSLRYFIAALGVGTMTAGLGACAGDLNPVRDVAVAAGAGPTGSVAPDFVRESRPPSLDYVPVGAAAPARAVPAKKKEEVEALEAELLRTRTRNAAEAEAARALATSSPPPEPAAVAPIPPSEPPPEPPRLRN